VERVLRGPMVRSAHAGAAPTTVPSLLAEVPALMRLEREVEQELRPLLRERLVEKIAAEAASLKGTAPRCDLCGETMKCRGRKPFSFTCRFGEVALTASTYRCPPCRRQKCPLLDKLGVEVGRLSGSLARLVALLGVVVPYELAARLVVLFFGVEISPMTVWRTVQRLGEALEERNEALARHHAGAHSDANAPASAPDAVLLGVDGCALGMQVRKNRRTPPGSGEKLPPLPVVEEGHFREVKTGVLLLPSERVEPSPGRRSVLRRALVTCLGNADAIFDRLWAKLHELQWLGPTTVVVIVGDGAEWIWNRAEMFPCRCEILDFWHAVEHAWEFARLHFGDTASKTTGWVAHLAEDLRAGNVEDVVVRLRTLQTSTPEAQDKLDSLIRYYTNNATRMRYDEYLRRGYGIGSGAIESAHKQVVHARLRQAGMRWSEAGARRLLALRVLLLNQQWSLLDRLPMARVA
jgi:hypothetical protein